LLRHIGAVLLLLGAVAAGAPRAVAQDSPEALAAAIEGPWYGHITGIDRPDRYLEIMAVEPGPRGDFVASALFGWGDGPISPTPAEITVSGTAVSLELTASTGAHVELHFNGDQANGPYQPAGRTSRSSQFVRVKDRPDYDWLGGVWIAKRNGQTRVFDVKRVVATPEGKILAIGQYGIAEETGRIRQMVATVDGDPASARIYWRTTNTIAELKRMTAAPALAGSFEVRDHGGRPEAIIFMQNVPAAQAAARQNIDVGRPFPDITLVTLDGDKVRASDYRGKTVLITIFQSWDVWSTDEMKAFRAAAKRYGDRLAILAVNYRALSSDVSPLSNTVAPVPRDIDLSDVRKAIDVKRIPEIWIVDGNGVVVDRESYLPEHRLLALLDKIVK
jgi:hypothetical protein